MRKLGVLIIIGMWLSFTGIIFLKSTEKRKQNKQYYHIGITYEDNGAYLEIIDDSTGKLVYFDIGRYYLNTYEYIPENEIVQKGEFLLYDTRNTKKDYLELWNTDSEHIALISLTEVLFIEDLEKINIKDFNFNRFKDCQ